MSNNDRDAFATWLSSMSWSHSELTLGAAFEAGVAYYRFANIFRESPDLGKVVRLAWIEWAKTQPDVGEHPDWLTPWEELSPRHREVDVRIAEAVIAAVWPVDITEQTTKELAGAMVTIVEQEKQIISLEARIHELEGQIETARIRWDP